MAIEKPHPTKTDFTTYVRVEMVVIGKNQPTQFRVQVYEKDVQALALAQTLPIEKILAATNAAFKRIGEAQNYVVFENTPGAELFTLAAINAADNNPYTAAYAWLKTYQPIYDGFADC